MVAHTETPTMPFFVFIKPRGLRVRKQKKHQKNAGETRYESFLRWT
jgi:hypothetical protein